jgi:sporulation protein YlmC with PRC-barrel domain
MAEPDKRPPANRRRLATTLREQIAVRRTIADQVISLAHLLGRPVRDDAGARVGRVSDIVVRWDAGVAHPAVVGVVVRVGGSAAFVECADVTLHQTEARLQSAQETVSRRVRQPGDVGLARDVLDRQLVDVTGVQVIRAADVYLVNGPNGWELAGVEVGLRSFIRRLLLKARVCPPPDRAIDWADLQAFVPRFTDTALPGEPGPAAAAGDIGGGVQFARPAAELTKLRAGDVAAILADLGRGQQAQVAALAAPSAAAEALRELDPARRDALLAELSETDRVRLQALLDGRQAP